MGGRIQRLWAEEIRVTAEQCAGRGGTASPLWTEAQRLRCDGSPASRSNSVCFDKGLQAFVADPAAPGPYPAAARHNVFFEVPYIREMVGWWVEVPKACTWWAGRRRRPGWWVGTGVPQAPPVAGLVAAGGRDGV